MRKIILALFMYIFTFVSTYADGLYENRYASDKSYIEYLSNCLCSELKSKIVSLDKETFVFKKFDTIGLREECKESLRKLEEEIDYYHYDEDKILFWNHSMLLSNLYRFLPNISYIVAKSYLYEYLIGNKEVFNKYTFLNHIYRINEKIYLFDIKFSKDYRLLYDRFNDSISCLEFINDIYIPQDLEEAINEATKILSDEDIQRILNYKTDLGCFFEELDLSSRKLRDHWQIGFESRISKFISKQYHIWSIYSQSGLIIVALRSKLKKEEFEIDYFLEFIQPISDVILKKPHYTMIIKID